MFSFDLSDWLPPSVDSDRDQMLDSWEQAIVDADPHDGITSVGDVLPREDFDTDGLTNENEFLLSSNPLKKDHPDIQLQLY